MGREVSLLVLFVSLLPAQVHKVPVSANWFPADAGELRTLLDKSFAAAQSRTGGAAPRKKLLALLAPHAALPYSGVVAASSYRLLNQPKNVIVLGFSHRRRVAGVAAPDLESYETPLGALKVNREAIAALGFRVEPEARLCDHSLENQLPFLQRAAPKAGLVPLYVGELSGPELDAAARKLAARLQQGDVIVASSDLTHYGDAYEYKPFPNDAQLPARLKHRAAEILDLAGSLDVARFDSFISEARENVCGWAPIRLMMAALKNYGEEVYPNLLDYLASGELARDYSLSVSYAAMAFYPASAFGVAEADQKKLLASARQTLDAYLHGRKTVVAVPEAQRTPELEQRSGVFVTIKKNGNLRGCIGNLGRGAPLWEGVADSTLAAAQDPRFPPLSPREAPVTLEVSLLTPLKRLSDWREFSLGHGGVISLDSKSGTILPQIAEEQRWSRPEQFLENLSLKAGLDANAYRNPRAVLYVYSAQVIREEPAAASSGGR